MEAERLVGVSRRALAQSRGTPDIIAEAWQAQALAQAIGSRLAADGPKELRGEARGLSEIGGRSSGSLDHPAARAAVARAAQLSGLADPRATLTGLGTLLGEVGMALVGVACETDEQGLYWQCMEAIDAADESMDRVHGMLRRLDEHERERQQDLERGRGRDGPYGAHGAYGAYEAYGAADGGSGVGGTAGTTAAGRGRARLRE
ncbi:DUF6099 family protein [Streptomyces sp. NPDC127118]|uniref:DUF6099 family protein n=1 Tax=unclassified Streptomyces TaxID=2593676 RepID=UPI00362C5F53